MSATLAVPVVPVETPVLGFHPAGVVTDHLLPVVGLLFAVYLLGLVALFLVTAAFKVTSAPGAHHPMVARRPRGGSVAVDPLLEVSPTLTSIPAMTGAVS